MMKTHIVIVTLVAALSGTQQANASEELTVKSVMGSLQMENVSKRPYQSPGLVNPRAEQAWQAVTLRGEDLRSQQTFKLHALSKRSF